MSNHSIKDNFETMVICVEQHSAWKISSCPPKIEFKFDQVIYSEGNMR